jgi:SAM-dependent methyltransferase
MEPLPDDSSPFRFADDGDFHRFRDVLNSLPFTSEGILGRLGVQDYTAVRSSDTGIILHRTRQGTPLDTAIRLFLACVPVDLEAARRAFDPVKIESLVETGLLLIEGNSAIARVKLFPVSVKVSPPQDFFIAYDLRSRLKSPLRHDYVMGIGSSTITLANLALRKQIGATLDLGTGCGFHSLLAARHSEHVAAVDLNPRAVRIANFNAKLNGMSHIECLEGDLFEPVQNRRFDLILSNPPFVISPGKDYLYRDSGMQGDQVCRKIVREAPDFLNEGGCCLVMCNWIEPSATGDSWSEYLRDWFNGIPCDVWVMRIDAEDAGAYASRWIRDTELDPATDRIRLFEEWMAYYERQGIKAIGYGLIAMRKSSGRPNWFHADSSPKKIVEPCGDFVERGFQLRDFLETVKDDSALLDSALLISPDAKLDLKLRPSSGEWVPVESHLSLAHGLYNPGSLDSHGAKLLIGCNGKNRLGDLLSHMAVSLEVDQATMAPRFCEIVRRLIEQGILLPPHPGGHR